jgi:hypothetical protein
MPNRLADDYLADIRRRKNRFMGQWTGTAGALAADCHRLLEEREHLLKEIQKMQELLDANQKLRTAVEERLAGTETACCEGGRCHPSTDADYETQSIPSDWILRGERELKAEREQPAPRPLGAGVIADGHETNEAEQLLLTALDVIRDRRPKYGGPRDHFRRTIGMINAAFSDVLKRPLTTSDWALIMTLDKVARFLGPTKTSDQITDLAGYAACLAECEGQP